MTQGQENKPAPAQDDLRARCAEILEWQQTGVLRGDALRNFAASQPYAGDSSRLQMAEADTAREAYQFVVQARAQTEQQPVSWQFYQNGKWWNGDDRTKDHRKNTEAAGVPVRELYAAPITQTAPQPEQDESLNMEPEGANAYLVVDPDDNYHICYVVRSKDQALQHATDGLLAFGPLTDTQ